MLAHATLRPYAASSRRSRGGANTIPRVSRLAAPRHFLTGEEIDGATLAALLARSRVLKQGRRSGSPKPLAGRSAALVFERPSTRTRVSFELAVVELGGYPVVLRGDELQLARGESIRDTALVLSRYVDLIAVRTGDHAKLEELARHASVPVVNLLSQQHHPCQALADLLTLAERFEELRGLPVAWVGDGNNVAHSLLLLGARAGLDLRVATPPELAPDPEIVERARAALESGGRISVGSDPVAAARGARALYTDVWVSMGREQDADRRRALLAPFRLDERLMRNAAEDAVVLHCLPAHPDEEIASDLLYGEQSAVWDQAENRLHAQKALLEFLLANE